MSNLTVGDSLSQTFGIVFKNVRTYLGTQGVFILILAVLSLAFSLVIGNSATPALVEAAENEDFATLFASIGALAAGGIALMIASVVLNTLALAMGIVVTDALQRNERLSFGEAWARATPRFGNLLGTTVLITLAAIGIMLAGMLLFFLVIPILIAIGLTIYLLARWAVAAVVSVFEARPVTENLKRSTEITQGARGTIVGAFLILMLLIAVPLGLASIPAGLGSLGEVGPDGTPTAATPSIGLQIFSWVINTLGQLAGSFLTTALLVIMYKTLAPPAAPAEPPAPAPLGFDPVTDEA